MEPAHIKATERDEIIARKPRLRRDEASRYLETQFGLPYAPATLATLATRGGGPAYQLANRTPLYPKEALDEWARAKLGPLRVSTSDTL
ncbi:hypothetical protein [Falsigemmobacter faecalis]|uniref:DNA-binding protein n=1 Tax=Falsigemmobacter faecalis TaxID=2488730 RepID=A0A3P3DQT3_9RHOB|nr:hypothetical protein [Falsigemmobacter faecalis]RRH76575.1 hypothetical protein EG244_05230 [Falsigemmobacter faecalis]